MVSLSPETWRRLLCRSPADADVPLFGPLLVPSACADDMFVLGRLAQSLDGYIATPAGESHWISGAEDILHTHRLRALFDAVVVGAGTVQADNPQLTTRLVEGPNPVRVVIDPARRLRPDRRVFQDGPRTLVISTPDAPGGDRVGQAEVLRVPAGPNGIDVESILATLARQGLRRIFIEGGGVTVSRFLLAGVLNRLHITVSPLVMGAGIPAFDLPALPSLGKAQRFGWSVYPIGPDILLDIPLGQGA